MYETHMSIPRSWRLFCVIDVLPILKNSREVSPGLAFGKNGIAFTAADVRSVKVFEKRKLVVVSIVLKSNVGNHSERAEASFGDMPLKGNGAFGKV